MILKNILSVIIVTLVMGLLLAASKKKPKKDEIGNIILQLPKLYPIIGILVIIGGIGLLIFASFFAGETDQVLAIISSLIAMIIGLLLFAKGYISHIKVSDLGIVETTMFAKQKEIKWSEIRDVSFGKVSLEMKITTIDKNIKAHMHLVGFDELVSKLKEKTGKTISQIEIPERNKKNEQKEQITQELEPLGVIKLYKNIDNKLYYWEAWDKDTKTGIVHWGEVGTQGQFKEVKSGLMNNYANKVRKEMEEKRKEDFSEFNEDEYAFLEIEYKIDGFGTEEDLDKRHRLESKMDQVLGWTGLGNTDGGSIGSGTMEVGCIVVDFEVAKKVIEESLKNTEFENYSRIFNMGEE